MPMHSLIEYSENYSKTSGSLFQYFKEIEIIMGLLLILMALMLLIHLILKLK